MTVETTLGEFGTRVHRNLKTWREVQVTVIEVIVYRAYVVTSWAMVQPTVGET